jgi:hypothetical protein
MVPIPAEFCRISQYYAAIKGQSEVLTEQELESSKVFVESVDIMQRLMICTNLLWHRQFVMLLLLYIIKHSSATYNLLFSRANQKFVTHDR